MDFPNVVLPPCLPARNAAEAYSVADFLLRQLESAAGPKAAQLAVRRKPKRRRATERKPTPLTPEQTEAVQLVGEYKGNIAAAARAAGKSRTAMVKLYRKATAKLGKKAIKHITQPMPRDRRGQETIAADEPE
jgi:predicted DNA-binding protein (UPF0251 family)